MVETARGRKRGTAGRPIARQIRPKLFEVRIEAAHCDDPVPRVSARVRSFVVSLHDVSPHTWEASARLLADLAAWGVPRTSLLVVADHHHRGHFLADEAFCR